MGLLLCGAVAGFSVGIARAGCKAGRGAHRMHAQRAAFERHVADVCVDAALRARASRGHSSGAP